MTPPGKQSVSAAQPTGHAQPSQLQGDAVLESTQIGGNAAADQHVPNAVLGLAQVEAHDAPAKEQAVQLDLHGNGGMTQQQSTSYSDHAAPPHSNSGQVSDCEAAASEASLAALRSDSMPQTYAKRTASLLPLQPDNETAQPLHSQHSGAAQREEVTVPMAEELSAASEDAEASHTGHGAEAQQLDVPATEHQQRLPEQWAKELGVMSNRTAQSQAAATASAPVPAPSKKQKFQTRCVVLPVPCEGPCKHLLIIIMWSRDDDLSSMVAPFLVLSS
jgi:hypothetical protein